MKQSIVCNKSSGLRQQGFTLIELMVTMVIALVVMGGLMLSFMQQHTEYNYQNKRIDVSQDVEFGINFMLNDFRSSLFSQADDLPANINIAMGVGTDPYTAGVSFKIWDATNAANNYRFRHCYLYRNNQIYFRRNHGNAACNGTTPLSGFNPVLENVTFFRVFQDIAGVSPSLGTITPAGAPLGLPLASGRDSLNTSVNDIPGYTILIEMAVDAGYKSGSFLDVKGVDVRTTADRRKRMWRYIQVYPGTVVQ